MSFVSVLPPYNHLALTPSCCPSCSPATEVTLLTQQKHPEIIAANQVLRDIKKKKPRPMKMKRGDPAFSQKTRHNWGKVGTETLSLHSLPYRHTHAGGLPEDARFYKWEVSECMRRYVRQRPNTGTTPVMTWVTLQNHLRTEEITSYGSCLV